MQPTRGGENQKVRPERGLCGTVSYVASGWIRPQFLGFCRAGRNIISSYSVRRNSVSFGFLRHGGFVFPVRDITALAFICRSTTAHTLAYGQNYVAQKLGETPKIPWEGRAAPHKPRYVVDHITWLRPQTSAPALSSEAAESPFGSWTRRSPAGGARGAAGHHSPQCRRIFSITSPCGGSMNATTFI